MPYEGIGELGHVAFRIVGGGQGLGYIPALIVDEGVAQIARGRVRLPIYHGPIRFFHGALAEGLGKRGEAMLGLSEGDYAAGAPVEPVRGLDELAWPRAGHEVLQRLIPALVGQYRHGGELIDDNHIAILV